MAVLVDERELIERYLNDCSGEAFEALFRTFCPRLVLYFRARGCDSGVAEDLTQNVMLNVYKHSVQVRHSSLFRAWMLRVAHNELVRHWERSCRQVKTVELDALAGSVFSRRLTTGQSSGMEFADSMAELLPQERQVIMLRYVEELEYREIAVVLDIPVGTAQWRALEARKKLARCYFGTRVV